MQNGSTPHRPSGQSPAEPAPGLAPAHRSERRGVSGGLDTVHPERPFATRSTVSRPAIQRPLSEPTGRRGTRTFSLLLAALGGFLAGAIVWHFVGFWSFLTHIVLKGPDSEATRQAVAAIEKIVETPAPQTAAADVGALVPGASTLKWPSRLSGEQVPNPAANAGACLAAVRGEGEGETALRSCPEPYATMAMGEGASREDRKVPPAQVPPAVTIWSTAVQIAPEPGRPARAK